MGGVGIDLELWRARVGMYHAARCRSQRRGKTPKLKRQIPLMRTCFQALAVVMMLSLAPAVVNMLLIMAGDVEPNPGPDSLHTTAASGNVDSVREFITVKGYPPDSRDVYGNTPLYYAALHGHCDLIKVLINDFSCNVCMKGQYGNSLVHAACWNGHLDCIRTLVTDFGCDPMERNVHNDSPVHIAAQFGHERIIKLLVEVFNCSALTRGHYGRTPLHAACQGGHMNVVRLLILEMQCEQSSKDEHGNAPIHFAALHGQEHIIKLLVEEFGCNAGEKGQYGRTPLHLACQGGHVNLVCLLILQYKCDKSGIDELGNAPIHFAALNGHESVIKLLAEEFGCNTRVRGQYGRTPLHAACQGGHNNLVHFLKLEMQCKRSVKDEHSNAPIHIAAQNGQEHVIKLLVEEYGCYAGEKGQYGWTPLCFACQGGHVNVIRLLISEMQCEQSGKDEHSNAPIHIAARNGQEHVVKLLVEEYGCYAGEKGEYGRTPLHLACQGGHVNVVRLLISEMQCEQSRKDEHGNAPIHIAARNGQEDVVKLLVEEYGCYAGEKGEYGRRPLHLACQGGHANVVRLLILKMQCEQSEMDDHGNAPIHIAARHGQEHVIKLLIEEFDCNAGEKGIYGRTPLDLACQGGHMNVVRLLILDMQCKRSAKNDDGDAPIHIAALHGQEHVVKQLVEVFGCNAEEKGQYGRTPLHLACKGGHMNVVRLLISEMQCEQSVKDKFGDAPIHIAALHGQEHVMKLLVEELGCNAGEKGRNRCTPLHLACEGGYVNLVHSLITDFNVEVMPTNERGYTPFDIAVVGGHIAVVKEFIGYICIEGKSFAPKLLGCARNWDLVRLLITEFNCDPTVCYGLAFGSFSGTPLHIACRNNDLDLVHMLITEFHVDTETVDDLGNTPLKIAVMSENIGIIKEFVGHVHIGKQSVEARQFLEHACERGNIDLFRILLLSFGCDPNWLNDSETLSSLHFACGNGAVDLVHALISEFGVDTSIRFRGASALETAVRACNVEVIREFIGHVNIEDHPSAFFDACFEGPLEVVRMLISEFGCDVMAENEDEGMTGLEFAIENNRSEVIKELLAHVDLCNHRFHTLLHFGIGINGVSDVTLELLLQHGVNLTSRDQDGYLPIHAAARQGRINIVSTLVNDFNCDPGMRGPNGTTLLHQACFSGNLDLVRLLIMDMKCDSYCQDDDGNTPLHFAARSSNDTIPIIRELAQENGSPLECLNNKRQTPLHLAAAEGWDSENIKILSELGCNHIATDIDGNTPLHLAAMEGGLNIAVVNELIEQSAVPLDCWNNCHQLPIHLALKKNRGDIVNVFLLHTDGNTPLHIATIYNEPERLRLLIQQNGSPHCLNSKKQTPLHLAAAKGNETIVKMLLSEYSCSPTVTDTYRNTPLHMAALSGRTAVLKQLAKQYGSPPDCQNINQQTPLHLAIAGGHLEVVSMLMSEFHCNINIADIDGNTVLHLAVRNENADIDLVISLLSEYKVSPNPRNSSGHSPLYYATLNRNARIVSELVKHNCNPAAFDEDYRTLEEISQEKLSGGSLTKVFVIGNKYAGKSTLVEALKNETQHNSCFTENVIPHTAGIIPSVHCSEQYGRVLLYDFAGDPEYYSSHAAALERLLTSSCHIFLLVEDFSAEEETILQTLGYWLTFISYNSKDLQTKSQVIIVGSHADITESRGENSEKKVCELFTEISSKFGRSHPYIEMVGYCSLDCRKSQSTGTEKLYNLLKHCCFSYSAEDRPLSVGAVLLLGVLQRDFKGVIACEVSQICRHIQLTEIYLPQGVVTVYSYLQELNAQGVILILGSREGVSKEWVILDVSTFLATVHKNLFSYTYLSHVCYMRSLSNLGLISESDLKNVLDKFDVKLLKQCLKYLQYCIELDDSEILQKIFENSHTAAIENNANESRSICGPSEDSSKNTSRSDSSVHITNSGLSLLFFPALLKGIQRSNMNWFGKESYTSCKGWYIQCSREYDYFPPRFLHVLLLRLAFNFTLPACSTTKEKNFDICSRRCIMWKSGIHWLMKTDVECVVEVVKQSKGVIVMIKSEREFDADCSCTFSEIVGKVLEAKQEFCHSLIAKEYLIHPDDMSQDIIPSFKDLHLFDMKEVKEALTENQRAVVSTDGQRRLPLSRLQIHRMWNILFPEVLTVREVLKSINTVVGEWFRLGLELGLSERTLKTIEYNHPKDVETCKRKMVQEWLEQPCPSWYSLVEALNEVGLKRAASKVSEASSNTMELKRILHNKENADAEITDKFIEKFAAVVGSMWPVLATLLSFTTAEIEEIKRKITRTVPTPTVKTYAAAMLKKWRDGAAATYGILTNKLTGVLMDSRELPPSNKRKVSPDDQPVYKKRHSMPEESPTHKRKHPDDHDSQPTTKKLQLE